MIPPSEPILKCTTQIYILLHLTSLPLHVPICMCSVRAGSIGNYMNYIKTMPISLSAATFCSSHEGLEPHRCTLLGERARPGWYSCTLAEPAISAEVTVGHSVALHRYVWPPVIDADQNGEDSSAKCIVLELSAAGLLLPGLDQPMQGTTYMYADT